jgi:hypothetical protein
MDNDSLAKLALYYKSVYKHSIYKIAVKSKQVWAKSTEKAKLNKSWHK